MDHLIKIFLERPDKLERILLLLLKSLIIIWLLNTMIIRIEPTYLDEFSKSENFISFSFLSKFSPFKSALYIVSFIMFWILLWEVVGSFLVPVLAKISQYLFAITILPTSPIILLVLYLRQISIKKRGDESEIGQIIKGKFDSKKNMAFFDSFYVFYILNISSKSSFGSMLLLLIIEHENSYFIKSRVMTYYWIMVTLFIGVLFSFSFCGLHIVFLIFLLFLGALVSLVRDVFKDFSRKNVVELRSLLPIDIYTDLVDRTFREHHLLQSFKFTALRKKLILKLYPDQEQELCDYPMKRLLVYRIHANAILELTPYLQKIERDAQPNTKQVIVCNQEPDIPLRNFMVKRGIHYLYARNENEVYTGLNLISKTIREWMKFNYPEGYFEQFEEINID